MSIQRGEVWWADLGEAVGAEPADRRPVLVVQADAFNRSNLQTVLAVALTSNLRRASAPGNVLLSASETGLRQDSVANVSQVATLDKGFLDTRVGRISRVSLARVESGLRLILDL